MGCDTYIKIFKDKHNYGVGENSSRKQYLPTYKKISFCQNRPIVGTIILPY